MISFLQPWALLALAAAAIPALLHLLGRRLPPVVSFPAVRYLTATEREHSRRLRLRNLLLLILRTLVIIFIVSAAAHPVLRIATGTSHPPTAVALVLDNSLSTSLVVEGRLKLSTLVESARAVLDRLNAGDRLWLVLADGIPVRTTRLEAARVLDSIAPMPVRLDLGEAVRVAAQTVLGDPLTEKRVVVVSDLQVSALSNGPELTVPVLAVTSPLPPPNRWLDSAVSDPPVWSPAGAIVATVGGSDLTATTVRLAIGDRDVSRAVAGVGDRVVLRGSVGEWGWATARVELDADELRADDVYHVSIYSGQPTAATAAAGAGRFVEEGLAVLQQGGRTVPGDEVLLTDSPGSGVSVVFPPADAALVGAVNRSLADRGVGLRFGDVVEGEWQVEGGVADGASVQRRYRLLGEGVAHGTTAGEMWLARDGQVILVGSRMDPQWTDLPVSARFVPFLDFLVNRIASREVWMVSTTAGEPATLPAGTVEIVGSLGTTLAVPGNLSFTAPVEAGVYFLLSALGDTIGSMAVNHDSRESRLDPADEQALRATLGSQVNLTDADRVGDELFRGVGRANLSGLMLWLALMTIVAEFAVASSGRVGGGKT